MIQNQENKQSSRQMKMHEKIWNNLSQRIQIQNITRVEKIIWTFDAAFWVKIHNPLYFLTISISSIGNKVIWCLCILIKNTKQFNEQSTNLSWKHSVQQLNRRVFALKTIATYIRNLWLAKSNGDGRWRRLRGHSQLCNRMYNVKC